MPRPAKKYTWLVAPEDEGQRLDQALASWLPQALGAPVSKAKVRKLIIAGAVYLNGSRVRIASKPLRARAKIDAYVDLEKLQQDSAKGDRPFQMTADRILYEDEYLIAVDKPAGLPTQPTLDEARDNLFASVKKFLADRDGRAQPYLGLHHRLDRDTSGVILFTKKEEANSGVAEIFSGRKAKKVYQALASSKSERLDETFEIKNYLGKRQGSGKKARFTAVRSGGDFAHTSFRVLKRLVQLPAGGRVYWIEAAPHTGRTHQIRVHLAEAGLPILGDATYGGQLGAAPRLMLHAVSLTFQHPILHTELSIQSALPEDFAKCLKQWGG